MSPRDHVAFAIAIGLVTWGVVLMIGLAWRNKSLSEGGGEIMVAVAMGLTAALVSYFTKNGDKK